MDHRVKSVFSDKILRNGAIRRSGSLTDFAE
jgi:hypothetical protein